MQVKLSYASGRINSGTYKIKVTGLGKYEGDITTTTFTISPITMKNCNISLSKNKLTYNGKAQKPTVTVKAETRVLKTNSNYIISYSSNKKIGEATVTIKGKGQNYSGTVIKTFKIVPRATKIQQLAKGNHKLSVKWSIMKKQCNGYQIQYSTSDKFTKKATKKSL